MKILIIHNLTSNILFFFNLCYAIRCKLLTICNSNTVDEVEYILYETFDATVPKYRNGLRKRIYLTWFNKATITCPLEKYTAYETL